MTNHPRRSRALFRTTLAACVLMSVSCSITDPGRSGDDRELSRNRQKWASAGLHDYEFDYQLSCFCAPDATEPVHVVVRGDRISAVTRVRDGLPAALSYGSWPTVSDLFDDVQQEIERKADRLDVTYDAAYGYPRSIVVDVYLMSADDESSKTASNLRPLH